MSHTGKCRGTERQESEERRLISCLSSSETLSYSGDCNKENTSWQTELTTSSICVCVCVLTPCQFALAKFHSSIAHSGHVAGSFPRCYWKRSRDCIHNMQQSVSKCAIMSYFTSLFAPV